MAIFVCKNVYYRAREVISGNGYVGVALGLVADALVELDLAALEEHIRNWKDPLILAGDFNAKARAWTGGPRDPRGDLLEEMMAAYNLVVANQPGVHTYEKGIVRSVLDLIFASPEVTKNISFWEVLDAVTQRSLIYIDKTTREAEPTKKVPTKYSYSELAQLTWKVLLLQKKQ